MYTFHNNVIVKSILPPLYMYVTWSVEDRGSTKRVRYMLYTGPIAP